MPRPNLLIVHTDQQSSWSLGCYGSGLVRTPHIDALATEGGRCGQVELIDDAVGRMLADLEEGGILGETIVVFTTDHGEYMGEHGLMHKNHLYETAYRIP